jgi:uncharacterized membrane protein
MSASPENLVAIFVMALAAMAAKGGGFIAMRWLGRHRFVNALLDHAPGAVLVSAAVVPLTQGGGAFIVGAVAGAALTRNGRRIHRRPVRRRRRRGSGPLDGPHLKTSGR